MVKLLSRLKAKILVACFSISFCSQAFCMEKLQDKYQISYGDPNAPIKIVEYFSFQCPHCLSLFRKDFKRIEKSLIDSKEVHWIFHPIPSDLVTVQGMVCLAKLNAGYKKIFLEAVLEEAEADNSDFTSLIMLKVMELLKNPISELNNKDFLEKTDAFHDAFNFLVQEDQISAVPTIEVNGKLIPKELPEYEFVQKIVRRSHG